MLNPISFISKIFKSSNQNEIDKIQYLLKKINNLEDEISKLEDKDFPERAKLLKSKIAKDSINEEDSILIIDDLIATGGTAHAAAKLVEISKGKVAGFIFVINLFDLNGSDSLIKKGYRVENLIEFPGH